MKIFLVFAFLTFSGFLSGQNLIGYKDFEIKKYMKEYKENLNFNKVSNDKFNYLKYSDNSDTQTLLFFLGTDSVCKSIRIICDSVSKTEKIKEYNTNCQKNGENIWVDRRNGIDYLIEIKDEQWSSVITIKPIK